MAGDTFRRSEPKNGFVKGLLPGEIHPPINIANTASRAGRVWRRKKADGTRKWDVVRKSEPGRSGNGKMKESDIMLAVSAFYSRFRCL